MKPEDVMRALESRGEETFYAEISGENVYRVTFYDVLALFRENRSQISVLKKLLERCETQFAEKDAEIERLTRICRSYALRYGTVRDQSVALKQIRTETIVELLNLIKSKILTRGELKPFVLVEDLVAVVEKMEGKK